MATEARGGRRPRSLRSRILVWLSVLFVTLLVVGIVSSWVAAVGFSNIPYDRELGEIAQAFGRAAANRPEGAPIAVPDEFSRIMLRDDVDRMFYKITAGDASLIAGDADLPTPPSIELSAEPLFENNEVRGIPIRLASLTVAADPVTGRSFVVVQVAETRVKRQQLVRRLFVTMVVPQILLTILASFGLWLGLGSGLAPLLRLRETVAARSSGDLSPLAIDEDTPDEVHPLIEAFNDVLGRMREVLVAQQHFVADAAHQLRTPLAGLKTQAELALRLDDPEALRLTLQQVLASAERGSVLITQLLTLARQEEAGAPVSRQAVDLNAVVRDAASALVEAAIARDIDLGFEPAPAPVLVAGDPVALREMTSNLIDNAVRYTQRGGTVTARVGRDARGAAILVEDNGPGIPSEDRERVFARFFRRLGTGGEGSGLGLAIVAEIARRHGASVSVADGPNRRGARFQVLFPIERVQDASAATAG